MGKSGELCNTAPPTSQTTAFISAKMMKWKEASLGPLLGKFIIIDCVALMHSLVSSRGHTGLGPPVLPAHRLLSGAGAHGLGCVRR